MRKFRVVVDGAAYEVDVEEVGGSTEVVPATVSEAPVATKAKESAPIQAKPKAAQPVAKPVGGTEVKCPMPGTVLKVNVENGAKVTKGQAIIVLEAMKMENDIAAPCDGTVSVLVAKGAVVESGSVIAVIA